jgi:O-antigen ligase
MLAVGVPLTTALGRGTVIPLLRPNEAILLLVLAGLALHYLLTRQAVSYTRLDIAVSIFAVGTSLIPWLVLLFTRADIDFDTWRAVLGPLQFLAVYLCFAQVRASGDHLKWLLNLTLLVSVIVGVIAIVELQNFPPGARAVVETYYPPDVPPPSYDTTYRPTSLLGVYGAVGAYAMLNFILALTLANRRKSRLSEAWLTAAMVVNLASLIASLTWAPAVGLLVGAAIVMWYSRQVPRQIWVGAATLVVVLVVLWPAVSSRIEAQQISLGNIQTLDARFRNWQVFFLPALAEHMWFGTGTRLPSELPASLATFVDNEYLRIGFRAGLVGIGLLISMLSVVGFSAWGCRESVDPWRRRLGAVSLAAVVIVVLAGFTAEYLAFGGLSQYIAMIFGLLAARLRHPAQSLRAVGSTPSSEATPSGRPGILERSS